MADLVLTAWSERRGEAVRHLRHAADEHDRIFAMGALVGSLAAKLSEMGIPNYSEQAQAERLLADQIDRLVAPA